jgi:hypothetical protein
MTVIATAGQLIAQAPHSMHKSFSVIRAFFSDTANTPCGQTSTHLPQPMQRSLVSASDATFFK